MALSTYDMCPDARKSGHNRVRTIPAPPFLSGMLVSTALQLVSFNLRFELLNKQKLYLENFAGLLSAQPVGVNIYYAS